MSAQSPTTPWDRRTGALGRATTAVYWLMVVDAAFVLAASPGLVGLALLSPDPSNLPLVALCLIPVGPAFAAAIAALRTRQLDDDPVPWRRFWRAWRRDLVEVLQVWVPVLAAAAVLGLNIAFGPAVGVPGPVVVVSVVVLAVLAAAALNALMLTATFGFRLRDRARLSVYFLLARPAAGLGTVLLVAACGAVALLASPWALVPAASLVAALVLQNARPVIADVEAQFTAPDDRPDGRPVTG